jgi:hypothetical protein
MSQPMVAPEHRFKTAKKRVPDVDGVEGQDFITISVSQPVGRINLVPGSLYSAVEAAFTLMGRNSPGDNDEGVSEYFFTVPGIGRFTTTVQVEKE